MCASLRIKRAIDTGARINLLKYKVKVRSIFPFSFITQKICICHREYIVYNIYKIEANVEGVQIKLHTDWHSIDRYIKSISLLEFLFNAHHFVITIDAIR